MSNVGGYDLEREIGAGAAGTVWKAFRRGPIPHPVALKRLRAASGAVDIQRLRREAAVLAELDHPHIVRVIEILEDGDAVAIAMQFAPGGSLEDLLDERGRLSPGEVVAITASLADALASAHRHRTVHGDVKPANVLFTSDGEPLLSDFGSVRTLGTLTSENFASTPEYTAPELLEGATPDARTDVYSLAVVCYHALTGKPPYAAATPLATMRAADLGAHEPLAGQPGLPDALAQAIERGMAHDPARRFGSAEEFGQVLRGAVPDDQVRLPGAAAATWTADDDEARSDQGGTVTFGPRPNRPEPETPGRKPRRLRVALVAAAFAMLVIGGIGVLRGALANDDDCPDAPEPSVEDGVQVVEGDPDGDGCTVYGTSALDADTETDASDARADTDNDGTGSAGDDAGPAEGDCIRVSDQGAYQETTSCEPADTGPYRVIEVVDDPMADCSDSRYAWVLAGDSRLCIEPHLHPGGCFVFPPVADDGTFQDGWFTEAPCGDPGTVEIVDIVPDAAAPEACEGDWDEYYYFVAPVMVACVQQY